MKIILVHNFYGSYAPSGENMVFKAEINLLKTHGHEVYEFVRHNDDLVSKGRMGLLKGAISTPWNLSVANDLKKMVLEIKPDIVHVHNTFPLISPAIFWKIRNLTSVVITLHNYRYFCPAAIPMRNGKVCTECIDKRSTIPAIRYGCYRGSRISTLPLALSVSLHRMIGTWSSCVDGFIVLSNFQKELLINAGLDKNKVYLKPNFLAGNYFPKKWEDRSPYVVFVGRLSQEKGIITLIKAWAKWGKDAPELRIIGDGPLRYTLENMSKDLPIRFLGHISNDKAHKIISEAYLLVLPSEWFETFGLVIIEAFALGTPVGVSDIGALPSLVDDRVNGIVFKPSNEIKLFAAIKNLWNSPKLLEKYGKAGRIKFDECYNENINYQRIIQVYDQVRLKKHNPNYGR